MRGFAERAAEADVAHDMRVLGRFTQLYCDGRHADAPRAPLASEGAAAGVYGERVPVVCEECAALLAYAEQRRARCPKDPKPACKDCDTHCYRPAMREQMRAVMRYAGPRAAFHGMLGDVVGHALGAKRHRSA